RVRRDGREPEPHEDREGQVGAASGDGVPRAGQQRRAERGEEEERIGRVEDSGARAHSGLSTSTSTTVTTPSTTVCAASRYSPASTSAPSTRLWPRRSASSSPRLRFGSGSSRIP